MLHNAELKTKVRNKEEAIVSSIKEDVSNVRIVH